jgi:hypothetical protein
MNNGTNLIKNKMQPQIQKSFHIFLNQFLIFSQRPPMGKSNSSISSPEKISASEIVSAGVSAQQHGFVPLDKEGMPIRPAKRTPRISFLSMLELCGQSGRTINREWPEDAGS